VLPSLFPDVHHPLSVCQYLLSDSLSRVSLQSVPLPIVTSMSWVRLVEDPDSHYFFFRTLLLSFSPCAAFSSRKPFFQFAYWFPHLRGAFSFCGFSSRWSQWIYDRSIRSSLLIDMRMILVSNDSQGNRGSHWSLNSSSFAPLWIRIPDLGQVSASGECGDIVLLCNLGLQSSPDERSCRYVAFICRSPLKTSASLYWWAHLNRSSRLRYFSLKCDVATWDVEVDNCIEET